MGSADLQRGTQLPPWRHGSWCRDHCPRYLLWILLFSGVISLSAASPLPAQTPPDWTRYTVPFTSPLPTDGNNAVATFSQRKGTYVKYLACGQENKFLSGALVPPANFVGKPDLGMLDSVMAKLEWLKEGVEACSGTFNVIYVNGSRYDFYNSPAFAPCLTHIPDTCDDQFRNLEQSAFGSASCFVSFDPSSFKVSPGGSPFTTVRISITAECLKAQIKSVLSKVQEGAAFPGTDGLPCNMVGSFIFNQSVGSVVGDWDMRMKTLIRILYLDSSTAATGPSILATLPAPSGFPNDQSLREYVQNELITVDGGPGPDNYSWQACGDNEKDTGTPQDREDENDSSSDFWDSVGDAFSWLFHRLLLIVVFLGVAGLIAVLSGLTGLPVLVLAALGVAAILAGQFPETENHRLMIESTRFLNNQLIIQDLGPGNAPGISSDQNNVKQWLLSKFQDIAKNDFLEYNARPYNGISLEALRNLADFSTDPDLRNGAQMLLEYSAAKFALGSNQGRRLVPFRRHFAAVDCIDGNPCPDLDSKFQNNATPAEIFNDFFQLGDAGVSLGLLYNGQTQQLPFGSVSTGEPAAPFGKNPGDPDGSGFGGALGDITSAATSKFQPNPLIADLAIRKDRPYLQKIHHAGFEIYSSSPSALITAGGIETDHAYHFMLGPVSISTPFDQTDNLGAGLPTTVILTGDPQGVPGKGQTSEMTLDSFISFRGTRKTEGNSETFTDNLCVWQNFACGSNLRMPNYLFVCLDHNPLSGPNWYFLDSSRCRGPSAPKFFIVFYLICPQDKCIGLLPANTAGFLEVVDNSPDTLASFEAKVIQNNQPASLGNLGQGCLTGGDCHGHYHTVSGHDLELELRGHQDDSEKTGITSVDGVAEKDLDNWSFAEGDIITSQGDGVIVIRNPHASWGSQLILNFRDASHPCRMTGPNQPCTQQ